MINHCDTGRNSNQFVGCFSSLISLRIPKDNIKEGSVSGVKKPFIFSLILQGLDVQEIWMNCLCPVLRNFIQQKQAVLPIPSVDNAILITFWVIFTYTHVFFYIPISLNMYIHANTYMCIYPHIFYQSPWTSNVSHFCLGGRHTVFLEK